MEAGLEARLACTANSFVKSCHLQGYVVFAFACIEKTEVGHFRTVKK